jgi:electron transport complex protein RnfC
VGLAVFNVATLAQIGDLLPTQRGLIERVVTVTGPGLERPGNYLVPLGTPVRFVLEHAGMDSGVREVIFGGPMMGTSVALLDVPLTKGVTGIVAKAARHREQSNGKVYPCIKCGECLQACPMHLNPSRLGILAENREYALMEEEYHLRDCFECGCCSFVCPSHIPLVQHFRIAKAMNRERKEATCP